MRHGPEPALGDQLQGLARLKRETVARDVDLRDSVGARVDVKACVAGRRAGEFGEEDGGRRGVLGWGAGGFVDVHGGRQAREAAVVEMRGAPVVVSVGVVGVAGMCALTRCICSCSRRITIRQSPRVIVQQSRLRRRADPHHPLQVPAFIPLHIRRRIPITRPGHKHRRVDDQPAQLFERLAEPGQQRFGRPDVRRRVGEQRREVRRHGGVVSEGVVRVEGAVDVEGALEGVVAAGFERLFAARPANEVGGGGAGEFVWWLLGGGFGLVEWGWVRMGDLVLLGGGGRGGMRRRGVCGGGGERWGGGLRRGGCRGRRGRRLVRGSWRTPCLGLA